MKWRTVTTTANNLRIWGDEYVVYNPQSGSTHLLGLAAGQILQKLEISPLDVSSLASLLGAEWQQEAEPDFVQSVQNLLTDLQALALIECA
ncbi:HPr-rel-A system PqqD family peptide chaperone [Solimicrobium silvestre]|uniref:PqqD family protein, HPr-rel-A system n=1 Tax=Solimicrobium silvestre TaxID=2099400 RepID=A0A2S9GTA7_9BURK|nr:HPr-rel-A system PqqD family peptide chaperone [Solimicrobium silvestre]PRC90943.1 PqqD family protein, HPr-rel-A system [Solimicrobium silvestre]